MAQKDQKAKQVERPKEEKKGLFNRQSSLAKPKTGRKNIIRSYFDETIGELRKVSWPTRKEALNLTIVVLVVMFATSVILGLLDFLFTQFFGFLFA